MTQTSHSEKSGRNPLPDAVKAGVGNGTAGGTAQGVAAASSPGGPANTTPDFPLTAVVISAKDKRGREILDVLWAVPEFKIYKTAHGINPHFSDDSQMAADQRERYLALGPELAQMNHLIHMFRHRGWRLKDRPNTSTDHTVSFYEREMARGIAQALTGKPEDGKATLSALSKQLEKLLCNKSRVFFFGICLIIASVLAAVLWAMFLRSEDGVFYQAALAAVLGGVGALLSTAVGLRSLRIDASATPVMNWVYGFQRMLVGVLGAVVLYIALRAGVVSDMIPGAEAATTGTSTMLDSYKLAFVSVLAGFSERLVPNLLDRDRNGNGADAKTESQPANA